MKLKIKKANKFYLVENDSTQQESTPEQSVNDIFTIKDTDSEFLQDFKEYCKSAVNTAEQPTEGNKLENAPTPTDNTAGEENREAIDNAAEGLGKKASDMAEEFIVNQNEGN